MKSDYLQSIKIANFLRFLRKFISWTLHLSRCRILPGEFIPFLSKVEIVFKTRGLLSGILYIKNVRTAVMNYLTGNPKRPKGIRCTTLGVPVCLGPLGFRLIRQDSQFLRVLLSVLNATRALKLTDPILDTKSITDTLYKGFPVIHPKYARGFWRQLGYTPLFGIPRRLQFHHFHFTTKTGPNGHALCMWLTDLLNLPQSLIESIGIMGGKKVKEFMSTAIAQKSILELFFPVRKNKKSFRRITYFPDKEDKVRVVAIGDYFSQTVLKPLHQYLFRVLKKIPQDVTFDQGGFVEKVKDWDIYYSVDLSSATDRFPIHFIKQIFDYHFPSTYVEAWMDIMVGYPFDVPKTDKKISYSVGNPMGFYSSWASFAVAHHYIFYHLSHQLGIPWKDLKYVVLGDDVLIGDRQLGELYIGFVKSLGVDISELKTHKSTTTLEFAKRWIHKGTEISPFPSSAIYGKRLDYSNLYSTLMAVREKGWNHYNVTDMASSFVGMFLGRPSSIKNKVAKEARIFELIVNTIRLPSTAGENINTLAQEMKISLPNISNDVATNIISNIMVELFAESNPQNSKYKGESLGDLAINMMMFLTSYSDEWVSTLIANPLAHAYGSIEEQYVDLLKEAKRIDTQGGGDWPLILRSMTIPLSDSIFVDRATNVEARSSLKVAKMLLDRLNILKEYKGLLL